MRVETIFLERPDKHYAKDCSGTAAFYRILMTVLGMLSFSQHMPSASHKASGSDAREWTPSSWSDLMDIMQKIAGLKLLSSATYS